MQAPHRLRVVLADDHPVVAEQLRSLLDLDFDVVATVGDGRALVDAVARLHPDVVVTDVAMPVLDGIAATRAIRAGDADARIVLVTVLNEPAVATEGFAAGALGYVAKTTAGEELVPAVRAAGRGERYLSPSIVRPGESPTGSR